MSLCGAADRCRAIREEILDMINEPNVDEMIKKLGTEDDPASPYVLCVVASKRARQISEQEQNGTYVSDSDEKDIVKACREIASGRVGYTKD